MTSEDFHSLIHFHAWGVIVVPTMQSRDREGAPRRADRTSKIRSLTVAALNGRGSEWLKTLFMHGGDRGAPVMRVYLNYFKMCC